MRDGRHWSPDVEDVPFGLSVKRFCSLRGVDRPPMRVSDDERERAVFALREHVVAGRLTLDEFTERVGQALRARVGDELVRIQADLPEQLPSQARSGIRPVRVTAAVFSHVVRRGRVRLRRRTRALSAFADLDLDLREATVESGRIGLTVLALFGNVDVYLPEGVDTSVTGLTIFGHRRDWGRDVGYPGMPMLTVRAFGFFGTVDVWRVPWNMRGDYGEIMGQLRKQDQITVRG